MLTVGELFAGIGGIGLGLERTGYFKVIWQVEIDEFRRLVLEKNWPLLRHQGFQCDVITGGFPCQDISIAGKRAGIKGERSSLWFDMLTTICLLRPKYVIVENVSEILRRDLLEVLKGLAEAGYNAEWFTLQASDIGAPHKRERTFIIAYSNEIRWHDGIYNYREDAFQENEKWDISKNIKSGRGWECWLNENSKADNGEISKSDFFGVDDGVSEEVDRIAAIGDSVVPQVAEYIGGCIERFDRERQSLT